MPIVEFEPTLSSIDDYLFFLNDIIKKGEADGDQINTLIDTLERWIETFKDNKSRIF